MEIISINVGSRQRLQGRSFNGDTGIIKEPVAGAVAVGESGLAADAIVHTDVHGGPDQAVYVYRQEDYEWWAGELGRPLAPGTFGENLTLSGLPTPGIAIGSRLVFDTVELEATAPRIPCNILATRMNDTAFIKRFMQAARPGFYCRVLTPGTLRAGERFVVAEYAAGEPVTTVEMFQAWHSRLSADEMRRFLAVPIDVRSRAYLEGKLAEAGA